MTDKYQNSYVNLNPVQQNSYSGVENPFERQDIVKRTLRQPDQNQNYPVSNTQNITVDFGGDQPYGAVNLQRTA